MSSPKPLAAIVPGLAANAMKRRGLAFGPLLTDWADIVGVSLADRAVPLKLVFPPGRRDGAVLHLRVTSAAALELQHATAQVLERINRFFGYGAVVRLKFVHGPVRLPRRPRAGAMADPARLHALTRRLDSVEDPVLKEALAGLASAMATDRTR